MGVQRLRERRRERVLASDQRAGHWPRGKARRLQREYVRRNWRRLGAVGGGLLLLMAAATPLFPGPFARGLYLGSFSTAISGLIAFWVVAVTGTVPTMMGDDAEQWTAQELRKLRRSGWRLINHISLEFRNVDHVLVGPGGAFAVETKWTANDWKVARDDSRVLEACQQVTRDARTMTLMLKKAGLGSVDPVVFLWGTGARHLPAVQAVRDGDAVTTVVAGPVAAAWRTGLRSGILNQDQIERSWSSLAAYCAQRDPREEVEAPVPLSVSELAGRAIVFVLAASASFLTAASWLSKGPSPRWWLPALLVLLLPALAFLYFARAVRYIAWGWLFGVGVTVLFIVYSLIRWALDQVS